MTTAAPAVRGRRRHRQARFDSLRRHEVCAQRVGRFSPQGPVDYEIGPMASIRRCWTYQGARRVAEMLEEAWFQRGEVWHFTVQQR